MTQAQPAKISLQNVVKKFGGNRVLDGLSLDLQAGLHLALIGSAASGKTVLLKCIIGLLTIDGGSISVNGDEISGLDAAGREQLLDRFGVLFQRSALFDSLPVWENIAFKRVTIGKARRRDAREAAILKLRQVGMKPETADLFPASLSGGMQKRVALARAIMEQPDILLLDDPTAGLDPILTRVINELIARVAEETGATILSVTSDMDAMRRDYPRAAMLHDGKIIWSGSTGDIDHADNPYLDQLVNGRPDGPIKMRLRKRAA
ncbi:MAG: ATP-binding cassette domain-containing protein [Alphaproteobacteria bacterium]